MKNTSLMAVALTLATLGCTTTSHQAQNSTLAKRFPAAAVAEVDLRNDPFLKELRDRVETSSFNEDYMKLNFISNQLSELSSSQENSAMTEAALQQAFQTSAGGDVKYLNILRVANALISSHNYILQLAKNKIPLAVSVHVIENTIFVSDKVYADGLCLVTSKLNDVDSADGRLVFDLISKGESIAKGQESVLDSIDFMNKMRGVTALLRSGQVRTSEQAIRKYKFDQQKSNAFIVSYLRSKLPSSLKNDQDEKQIVTFLKNFGDVKKAKQFVDNLSVAGLSENGSIGPALSYSEIVDIINDIIGKNTDPIAYSGLLSKAQSRANNGKFR
jgi:hypothetical protein